MIGPLSNISFIMFIIFLVSLFVYVTVLCAIIKYRNDEYLSGAFFKFSFLLGIYDIIAMIATWFLMKFRYLPPFFEFYTQFDPFLARLGAYLTWLSYYGQLAGLTIIAINRFTCIVFPLKTLQFWNTRKIYYFILAAVVLPFLASVPELIYDQHTYVCENGTIVINVANPDAMNTMHLVVFIIELPLCIAQLALYIVMFVVGLIRQRKMLHLQSGGSNRQSMRQQIKLALTGFILTLAFSGMVVWDGAAANGYNLYETFGDLFEILIDFFCECNPYLLLACSSHLRKKYLEMFGIKQGTSVRPLNSNGTHKTTSAKGHRRKP